MELQGDENIDVDSQEQLSLLPKDIYGFTTMIVNVFMIGDPHNTNGDWVLVDTGISSSESKIIQEMSDRYGENRPPSAIVLTHGHFDHVGAAKDLSEEWNIPVYAHRDELPYLTGEKDYPPGDPSVGGGSMATMSPLYPHDAINLGNRVQPIPENGNVPFLTGWRVVHTPGHTPGHISLFRETDGALIVGDAFITVKQESVMAVITQKEEIHGPPMYFTQDWSAAWESVKQLEALKPKVAFPGHGKAIYGEKLSEQLKFLAENFDTVAIPVHRKNIH